MRRDVAGTPWSPLTPSAAVIQLNPEANYLEHRLSRFLLLKHSCSGAKWVPPFYRCRPGGDKQVTDFLTMSRAKSDANQKHLTIARSMTNAHSDQLVTSHCCF
jgi:hypothetical protein